MATGLVLQSIVDKYLTLDNFEIWMETTTESLAYNALENFVKSKFSTAKSVTIALSAIIITDTKNKQYFIQPIPRGDSRMDNDSQRSLH